MQATKEEDSYQEYKKYLEDSLGITGLRLPPRPHTPYTRYFFEKSCQQRSKGNYKLLQFTRGITEEWKKLDEKKRQYYQKIYDLRNRQRQDLMEQYLLLSKKKKPMNGYSIYFKKRYRQLTKQRPNTEITEINRMIAIDWKNVSEADKQKYNKQASNQQSKNDLTTEQREARIDQYHQKVQRFAEQLKEEKQKILKKYGLHNLKEQRKLERQRERKAKMQALRKSKQEQKQKQAEQKKKKRTQQVEKKKKEKEDQKKSKDEGTKKPKQEKVKKQLPKKAAKQVKEVKEQPRTVSRAKGEKVEKSEVKPKAQKVEKAEVKQAVVAPRKKVRTSKAKPKASTKKQVPRKGEKKTKKIKKSAKTVQKPSRVVRQKKGAVAKKEKKVEVKKQIKSEVKVEVVQKSRTKSPRPAKSQAKSKSKSAPKSRR